MANYQAYVIDVEGQIIRSNPIAADSDIEALSDAKRFIVVGYRLEIWDGERKVGGFNETVDPEGKSSN